MRILHILDHSAPLQSGYVSRTLAILHAQRAMGWETFQLTGPKHPECGLDQENAGGLTFHRTSRPRGWLARAPMFRQLAVISALRARLLTLAQTLQPDLLHAHSPVLNGLAALSVARQLRLPLIYEVRAFWEDAAASHGTAPAQSLRYRLTRAAETRLFRQATGITVICQGLGREIAARGIPADKIATIPNAVELHRFAAPPPSLPILPGFDTTHRTILGYIGSFYAYEGLSLLLDSLPAIRERHPEILLLLVGGGPEEERLRQQCRAMNLDHHVCFTGRVTPETIPGYHALVDLMVFPRLPMRLTQLVTPLKPLEAMAARRLVVASDVAGHQELIASGQTGFLFPAGQKAALASTLLNLLDRRADWERVIGNAEQYVRRERNWTTVVEGYGPVYARALRLSGVESASGSAP
ncbi:MAG: glycosyltransferase, exosortase A system-associated [Magnetococcales bacterium]|nr:glycosyltransferase, exosortase A system-associated [Magnetococcales bacterium]